MANIYNYLSNAFLGLKERIKQYPPLFCIVLMLLSVPLAYSANSVSLGIFVLVTGMTFGIRHFRRDYTVILPILLYILMALSLIWSINPHATFQALSKELPLIIIPLCFLILPLFNLQQKQLILKYYSYGMALFCVFYLLKAAVRFAISGDVSMFFYHELVTLDV